MRQAIPFGKYLLLDRISVGGMAEVFKAKSYGVEGFEKVIAIKRILPSMGEDRDFIKMFIDEAKIAGQLAHANICQIFELGRTDGAHFIAMEFIWGKDLLQIQNRMRKLKSTMAPAMACFVVAKVCEGLDYAHRKRDPMGRALEIVHRDCSPQNVIISYEGEVKIIDFGIAKAASRSSRTMHGVLKGKFGYMSPEQVRGLPLDRRSDIFALGTILYECLTSERLFQGDTDFATLEKVRNVDIAPPRQLNPQIPAEVERIIMRALARDVDVRYQWCGELLADLQAYLMAQPQVFTAKSLAGWMKEGFAPELEKERGQLESYKKLGREGLIAGVPQAQAKLDVVEHFGPAGQTEDPTVLGGPSFDDIIPDGATQITDMGLEPPTPGNAVPAVAGEVVGRSAPAHEFPEEEGPTTIFGDDVDDDSAPTLPPATPVPARITNQSPAVPVPRHGQLPTPPMHAGPANGGGAPSAPPQARTLYGMPAPVIAQPAARTPPPSFPAGTAPGAPAYAPPPQPQVQYQYPPQQQAYIQGYVPPSAAGANDPTVMNMDSAALPVDQLVAQAQAELARHRAQQAQQAQPMPPPPNPAASAQTVMGMQPPQLPLQPGPPSGGMQAYAYDPAQGQAYPHPAQQPGYPQQPQYPQQPGYPQQPQYPQQYPVYPPQEPLHPSQMAAGQMQPGHGPGMEQASFTPSGILISPPTHPASAVTAPVKKRRSSLGKDIAIGIGIAAVVLGLVAIVKFAVLGDSGGARRAEASSTGSVQITVPEGVSGSVWVGGEKKGDLKDGSLMVEELGAGEVEVKVTHEGAEPCVKKVDIAAGEVATVECSFAVAMQKPEPPQPAVVVDAGVAPVPAVVVDAAPAPLPAVVVDAAPAPKPAVVVDAAPPPVVEKKKDDKKDEKKDVVVEKKKDEKKDVVVEKKKDDKKKDEKKKDRSGTGTGSGSGSGSGEKAAKEASGFLVAYTTPWAKVLVDGKDTGKMTPIAPRAKISLPPGKHKVTFVVGRESWSYPLTITAGETTKITKDLQVTSP